MRDHRRNSGRLVRAGARGLVAAMAMTGTRSLTGNLGLVEKSPPRAIIDQHAPARIRQLADEHRTAATELAHWSYGAVGGAVFGLLPSGLRARLLTGPAYGLAVWLSFELGVAPLLGVQHTQGRVLGRMVIALDHVLYGIVVAGRLAPEPAVIRAERGKQLRLRHRR